MVKRKDLRSRTPQRCAESERTSGRQANTFGNRPKSSTVVLPCLIGEAKVPEENDWAHHNEPSGCFQRNDKSLVRTPDDGRELIDMWKVGMYIDPTIPRLDRLRGDIEKDGQTAERHHEGDVSSSQQHQAEISVGVEVGIGRKKFLELWATLPEGPNAQSWNNRLELISVDIPMNMLTAVDRGNTANCQRPGSRNNVGNPGIVGEEPAANVLIDIKSMTLVDVFWGFVRTKLRRLK